MKRAVIGMCSILAVMGLATTTKAQEPPKTSDSTAQTPAPAPPAPSPQPTQPSPSAPANPNAGPSPAAPMPTAPPTNGALGYQYPYSPPTNGQGAPLGEFRYGPKEVPYQGGPIPFGYVHKEKYSTGLLVSGPILFALGYTIAAVSAQDRSSSDSIGSSRVQEPWRALYIPITGPFAVAAYASEGVGFIYALIGIGQATGVALTVAGIFNPKEVLVRRDLNEAFRPRLEVGPGNVQLKMRF